MDKHTALPHFDHRTALPPGSRLSFPGLTCTIISEIGRGSNALVYRAWYADHYHGDERHEVLIKELFPAHPNGAICRGADGGIICQSEGEAFYADHRESFEAGNAAHLALLRKQPDDVGGNLNTYALNNTLYTVLGFNGGRSLKDELKGPAISLRPLIERMIKLLDALELFHESGLLHLDIAPDNIMLLGRGQLERVMLIDYNSCMPIDVTADSSTLFSIKQGYTAPELQIRRYKKICPATDLYSVTAVLFRGITGRALEADEASDRQLPDVTGAPCLVDMPDTVVSWLRTVLRKGLESLPRRRYQSVGEMREALSELLDRIDGVGITHSALWEAGRRNIIRTVRGNPSLAFIQSEEKLFPVNAALENEVAPVGELLGRLAESGKSAQLVAGGGMGKTTTMLRAALELTAHYAVNRPATVYLSLYGWQPGEQNYILNRILETLRFKSETRSFEDARKALLELLDHPLSTPQGERPVLMLMLDGLNETIPDRQPLIEEILRLASLRGVGLVISTRTDEASLPFLRLKLTELTETDVNDALADAGLLMPEAADMRRLLGIPLMLSIFIQSSLTKGGQLSVRTQNELMAAYISALREKEVVTAPDNGSYRWQLEAALDYVLPSLAGEMARRNRPLEDARLLPVVEECWKLLKSRLLRRAFPRWIGRSTAIRGGASNAEEWYGRIVHELLWKRMGMLIRDEQGRYQIAHQIIEEYLLGIDRENRRRIVRRQRVKRLLIGAVAFLALCGCAMIARQAAMPKPYAADSAQTVFEYAIGAHEDAVAQVQAMRDALERAKNGLDGFKLAVKLPKPSDTWSARDKLKQMVQDGKVMPWSGLPIDQDRCEELLRLPRDLEKAYTTYLRTLNYIMANEATYQRYVVEERYPEKLSSLVELDAQIADTLYDLVCLPHLTGDYATAQVAVDREAQEKDENGEDSLEKQLVDLTIKRVFALLDLQDTAAIEAEANRLTLK